MFTILNKVTDENIVTTLSIAGQKNTTITISAAREVDFTSINITAFNVKRHTRLWSYRL